MSLELASFQDANSNNCKDYSLYKIGREKLLNLDQKQQIKTKRLINKKPFKLNMKNKKAN